MGSVISSLDDIMYETERAMRSYVGDEANVRHFRAHRDNTGMPPLVPNLALSQERDSEAIANAIGASLYRGALEQAGMQETTRQLAEKLRYYKERSRTDELTGIDNRRSLDEKADLLFARAHRESVPVHVLMIDIDCFKEINDRYGHPKGDEVLAWFAEGLRATSRASDVVGRYGGEEFSIVAYGGTSHDVRRLAERIRTHVEERSHDFFNQDRELPNLTVSIGMVTHYPSSRPEDAKMVRQIQFARADECLYRAKQNGRNKVVSIDPQSER
ncbi:MAG: GGDEF domain-containing protein [Candidatus Woesearchaeota archaeon]